ncbi:MAG: hypothetical protein SH850_25795 [Planctomycetaceae bacterium]|nr:hypothetical protein [Planctomycetaceae bacterium]
MVRAANVVEVEIDGPQNQGLMFGPLQRRLRGRFDSSRLLRMDDGAAGVAREWPEPIPGQRLRLDLDGAAAVVEPLHDAEHATIKEKLNKRGSTFAPAVETIATVHVPTWVYWLRRAVEAGHARIVSGQLPEKLTGAPQLNFLTPAVADPVDKLTAALDRQSALLEQLLTALAQR